MAAPLSVPGVIADGSPKGLKGGALGLLSSVVIGVASTAPGYSLAATLGFIVVAVGLQSPVIMLLAFVPMYLIAVAYRELNAIDPDCGTGFKWVARAFGTRSGWLNGWVQILADVVVMANLAQIAGQYGFLLFGADGLAASTFWTTVAGVLWIAVMTYICYRGIEVSARFQQALLGVELLTLAVFAATALIKVYSGHGAAGSIHPSLSWFNPFDIPSFSALSEGILLAVFIYWGWDTAVSINEESADKTRTPGRAAVISTVLLLVTYVVISVAAQSYAGVGDKGIGLANPDNSGDVFAVLGDAVLGSALAKVLIIAVLSSAAASTQTTILPAARTALSMAAYKAAPDAMAQIHPRYKTPGFSTLLMGGVSIVFYVGLTLISGNVLADSIASLGLFIAFYLGVAGIACAWTFRDAVRSGARDAWVKVVMPLIGGVLLLAAMLKTGKDTFASDYGDTSFGGVGGVFLLGVGGLVLGVVLMVVWNALAPTYFTGRTFEPVGGEQPEVLTMVDEMPLARGEGALP
ncbi:amino acid/polyamine/organocation transporter (APC superfamily) [Motilibacter rhizosphaerae]|uniref:Amino acid/polyamine/organocation transporter (APC superfamily) n=1 Tax=Motilibacter rhizosphaerae TaxID=598652 RepID=A0A4Q7NS94_9ACTN|nr:APC family permease [Motilibacter rhizosphaerae]RZS89986.1 amino acid/polyamine/organocation transporter (APC superfamily) [Motilibacter rhizosphaerae]